MNRFVCIALVQEQVLIIFFLISIFFRFLKILYEIPRKLINDAQNVL